MNSTERIHSLIDSNTWRSLNSTISSCDPLEFKDQKTYIERLIEAQERTKLKDAIQTGIGSINGIPVALGVMDFYFMGGSMGSVVGEKITRLIELATQLKLPIILICASGGARMQEGIMSLMQMAKIASALKFHQNYANLLYISILTSPTTGGVTASFAMLGDLIIAEPKALVGFAGRRVIEQSLAKKTINNYKLKTSLDSEETPGIEDLNEGYDYLDIPNRNKLLPPSGGEWTLLQLPKDFQTAEYLLNHGLLDLIIHRSLLKQALSEILLIYSQAP